MTDYSELSDFEINKCVAVALGHSVDEEKYGKASIGVFHSDGLTYKSYDYCNNPADAWPIIFENKIMLSPRCADDEWKAEIYLGREDIFDNYASAWHKNPLRAAMIVFLMMQDANHANS